MRERRLIWIWLLLFGVLGSASQRAPEGTAAGEQFVGTWIGSWDTSGSGGGFELTLEKGKDGVLGGTVSITGEPTYKATLNALSFDGSTMIAKYDFPAAEGAEVVLSTVFEGSRATGTWSLREKASGSEAASGGMVVTKK